MTQLKGIIYYELLMSWRRRSLPLLILFFLVALLFIGILVGDVSSRINSGMIGVRVENGVTIIISRVEDGSTTEQIVDEETARTLPPWLIGVNLDHAETTMRGIYVIIPALMVMIVGIIPLLSETIPLDRQYKVRDLLDTTPMHHATYLGGKILSVWSGLLVGVILCMVVVQVLLYLLYGAYDIVPMLLVWLAFVTPLTLFVSGCIVLLTSWADNRRTALLTSIFLIPAGIYIYFVAAMTLGNIGRLTQPFYGLGLMDTYLNNPDYRSTVLSEAAVMLAILLGIGGVIWAVAWGYARRIEAR